MNTGEYYRRAVESNPHDPDALCELALWCTEAKFVDEGELLLSRALESNPTNADVMDALATFFAQHRHDKERAAELRERAERCRQSC